MTDALGVDLGSPPSSGPVVITATLPESVIRNAKLAHQIAARREWDEQRETGKIPENEEPPAGVSAWLNYERPLIAGVFVAVVLGLLVQLVAEGLGHLFAFRPSLVGVWVGLLGGALAGVAVLMWQDRARDRDAKVLAENQRKISDAADKVQMIEAHMAAMKVSELWPQLPVREGPVGPLLRNALWDLSGELLERRRLADTLADLRQAAVGAPADNPAANELKAQITRADTLHKARDAEVTDRIGRLHTLAARCVRFCDEQAAIKRAQQANRRADAVLGAVQVTDRQPVDEIGAVTQQLDAVLDAYRRLVRDDPDGG